MNALENWFCSSAFWRRITERDVLPRLLADVALGDHVLEIGAGAGAATAELRRLAPRVTSLEFDPQLVARLAHSAPAATVVQADASALPFTDATFSCAIAILVLHHLKTSELQERAFAEVFRVLRPGGVFVAAEIPAGWFHRAIHWRSTFVPVLPETLPETLARAGFRSVQTDFLSGGFRFRAHKS